MGVDTSYVLLESSRVCPPLLRPIWNHARFSSFQRIRTPSQAPLFTRLRFAWRGNSPLKDGSQPLARLASLTQTT